MNRTASSICLLTLLCACGGNTTAEFGPPRQVPKEKREVVWDAAMRDRLGVPDMGGADAASTGGGAKQVVASTPAGWEELPANPARFRNAVWRIAGEPETDCYLTIAVGGGVAGNLHRWYVQQFGKPDMPAAESLPPIALAGRSGRLVELEGTLGDKKNWSALIAFYNDGDAVTSLKFTGPVAIVQANKKQFLSLAESIRLASASPSTGQQKTAPPILPGQAMPDGHPPTGGTPPAAANTGNTDNTASAPSPFTATTPDGWVAKPGRRILNHTFGSNSEVYLSQLGGQLKPSLDIWRGELNLKPMSDAEFQALPNTLFLGDDGVLLDLAGTFRGMNKVEIPDARLLIAARSEGTTITFCKLVGPKDEVDAQRDAFVQFCGSIRRAE